MNNTAATYGIMGETPDGRMARTATPRGFTLVEMMIVVTLIMILAGMAIPTIMGMFSAGADNQAYNTVSSLLTSARAYALKTNNYVAVHFQMADPNGDPGRANTYYAALLEYRADLVIDPSFPNDKGGFVVAQGFDPIALHNNMALGQLSGTFLKTASPTDPTTSYNPTALDDSGINGLKEFMTFTIVFSPKGTIVPTVSGRRIYFGTSNSTSPSNPPPASYFDSDPTKRLWALATGAGDIYTPATVQGKTGVGALTVFDLTKVEIMSPDARAAYLIENAPFLPVNCYTGQLFQRQ